MSEVDAKIDVAEQTMKIEDSADLKVVEQSADSVMKDAGDTEVVKDVEVKVEDEKPAEAESTSQIKRTKGIQHKNNKFDPSSLPETDDPSKIRAQVEFYFSDANLIDDRHLKEITQSEKNLPVKISHIHTFKRMRRFQPYSAVVAALRESSGLVVTGSEGEEMIHRKFPFDEAKARQDQARARRSVYVRGFGAEEPTTQFDIETFFVTYGPVRRVKLRREDNGSFKGSVYAEFDSEEAAQKFLSLDPKPVYKDCQDLFIKCKAEYEREKNSEIKNGEKDPTESRYNNKKGRGGGYRGDNDDWKNRRDHDRNNGFRGDGGRGRGGRGGGGRDGGGRGGRGRGGRGGRGDRRDNRGSNGNRNGNGIPQIRDTTADNVENNAEVKNVEKDIKVEDVKKEPETEQTKKRARENDDVSTEETPAKREKLAEDIKAE